MPLEFIRIPSGHPTIELIQGMLERDKQRLNEEPIRDCRLLESQSLEQDYVNKIEHGLGRIIKGYIITRQSDPCFIVWPPSTTTTETIDLSLYLPLSSSGNVTVDLLVF